MKRQLLVIAALAAIGSASLPSAVALARDDDRGRRAERVERGDGPRGGPRGGDRDRGRGEARDNRRWVDQDRGGRGPGRRADDDRRARVPALGYGDDRRRDRDDDGPRRADRRYDQPPARGFAPPPSARRGGYLPDSYRGSVVDDYRRYRLRPPPQGYAWVRVGGGFALVSMADGRVFDMVD